MHAKIFALLDRQTVDAAQTDRDISEVSVDGFAESQIDFTIQNNKWDDNQRDLDDQCRAVCVKILDRCRSQ